MVVEETRNPALSRFVMEYLGLQPGQVHGVMLVCVHMSSQPESIFHALHTVKKLVTGPITYIVNSTQRAQLVVKCINPWDAETLDYSRGIFKFDEKNIKCINLESVARLPLEEDEIFQGSIQDF